MSLLCDNFAIEKLSNIEIPIRLLGRIKVCTHEFLKSDQEEINYFDSDNYFIYRSNDGCKKPVYFSEELKSDFTLSNLIKKNKFNLMKPLIIDVLFSYSNHNTNDNFKTPVITYEPISKGTLSRREIIINIDHILIANVSCSLSDLCFKFNLEIEESLKRYRTSFIYLYENFPSKSIYNLIKLYFELDSRLLSVILPLKETENEEKCLFDVAKELSVTSRQLRRPLALYPTDEVMVQLAGSGDKLVSPHLELAVSSEPGTTTQLVRGRYTYYHYLQDGATDRGWGCVYRIIQTIVSWYLWQGLVSVCRLQVPSLDTIQSILVKIGDKRAAFLGSRDGIGSVEISIVLQHLLHIDIRIIPLQCGSEIPSVCQELEYHFAAGGPPVMISGDQLAHTIVGVCRDPKRPSPWFLVLDPNFPCAGKTDLATVLKGGWCAWQDSASFWRRKQFYRLCLPGLPA